MVVEVGVTEEEVSRNLIASFQSTTIRGWIRSARLGWVGLRWLGCVGWVGLGWVGWVEGWTAVKGWIELG